MAGAYLSSSCSLLGADQALNVAARFVPPAIAEKYGFEVPEYEGIDQVVELPASEQKL